MFKLYKLTNKQYAVRGDDRVLITGTRLDVLEFLMNLGVDSDEIFMGLDALQAGDDIADYGVNKMFIYSEKIEAGVYNG